MRSQFRRYFSREFKLRVLSEVRDGDVTLAEAARRHGLSPALVRAWKQQFGGELGFLPHMPPHAQGPEAELESLRRETAALRRDNELLKKMAHFLETTALAEDDAS
jgi:transposase-like protein